MKNAKNVLAVKVFYFSLFLFLSYRSSCPTLDNVCRSAQTKLQVHPFQAYRPSHGLEEIITCPSFNCINLDQARIIAQQSELSFLHVLYPEVNLPAVDQRYYKKVYSRARGSLRKFIRKKWLTLDEEQAYYLYRQQQGLQSFVSIMAKIHLDSYLTGLIRPHERTRANVERWFKGLLTMQNADVDPVMLFYQASEEINAAIAKTMQNKPDVDFIAEDGVRHSVWIIHGLDDIKKLRHYFTKIPNMYIADGHHRMAVKSKIQQEKRISRGNRYTGCESFNYILAALYAHDHVNVVSYNRLIKDLNGLSASNFLIRLRESFDVKAVINYSYAVPLVSHAFGLYLDGMWHRLTLKASELKKRAARVEQMIGVTILSDLVFQPILSMNIAGDEQVVCIPGSVGARDIEKKCEEEGYQAAFIFYPVQVSDIMNVVDARRVMPPKTTFFMPKVRAGLFVRVLSWLRR